MILQVTSGGLTQAAVSIFAAGLLVPLWAWWTNRRSSLGHALLWGAGAGIAWILFLVSEARTAPAERGDQTLLACRYLALCLTGGAGVAVLGARRPYVGAWNFVVVGLLAVMLLPLFESIVLRKGLDDPLRIFFMGATIAVGALNYVPTCAGPAALLLIIGCAGQMLLLFAPEALAPSAECGTEIALLLAPWGALLGWRWRRPGHRSLDQLWLSFRDRYGLLWSQRVREQFNHAARHAGWPAFLGWRGLRRSGAISVAEEKEMLRTLEAALKRFA
jgi:hypothetical protein